MVSEEPLRLNVDTLLVDTTLLVLSCTVLAVLFPLIVLAAEAGTGLAGVGGVSVRDGVSSRAPGLRAGVLRPVVDVDAVE